jgi:fumarylacetoacetase
MGTRASECWIPIPEGSGFRLENLPLGIGVRSGTPPRPYVAVGDHALDLAAVAQRGLLGASGMSESMLQATTLNAFLAAGRPTWEMFRTRLTELLTDHSVAERLADATVAQADLVMVLPVEIGDYIDFYSSLRHATNLGMLFRGGTEPLYPNWRRLPVGYHGRSGTIVVSGEEIPRPRGLRLIDGEPIEGPSTALDIELEVAFVVGAGSDRGTAIRVSDAADHIYGFCLVNDWSARDIQAYEYQPLGPFLGKSFATSMSPWLVSFEALAPYRVAQPIQDPPVADYLRVSEPWGFDLHLEVQIESEAMRAAGRTPMVVSRSGFADMYWTAAQQLAHATVNGAATRPGDLFASGTISGPTPGSEGSLLELTWRGERPLELPDGTERTFLRDGDRVILRGWAGGDDRPVISLGEVSGTITPARRLPGDR